MAPILYSNIRCVGLENGISNCYHDDEDGSCDVSRAANAICQVNTSVTFRLVGDSALEGRLEVEFAGTWGGVCSMGWDNSVSDVVCQELGLGGAISTNTTTYIVGGDTVVWLSEVRCEGEGVFSDACSHPGWANVDDSCYTAGNNGLWIRCNGRYSLEVHQWLCLHSLCLADSQKVIRQTVSVQPIPS